MVKKRLLLLLFMLLAIFYFSHTPSLKVLDPSTWINPGSSRDGVKFVDILRPGSEFYSPWDYGIDAEFFVRKLAHFSFFGILACLFAWNLRYRYVVAWVLTTLYALSDEFHQAYTMGRDGRIMDVGIDSLGAIVFLCGLYVVHVQITKKQQSK
ncbi:VanZ family protein [Priestia koreensis]|uniref:VanZ-like domain-containing protein n=1 Tax=Priestia koreensis TaxID=284581 RepID=A0A0M0LHM4_9BACI|nr:VanZ family protein [Priestia koreensis]KOO50417.1 hypothetical protein AMD01_01275 [Priestia koreensis]